MAEKNQIAEALNNADAVLEIEGNMLGLLGFLRSGRKIYSLNKSKYIALKRHFDSMNPDEALQYIRKSAFFVDNAKKLYNVDLSEAYEKLLLPLTLEPHFATSFSSDLMGMPTATRLKSGESGKKIAMDIVNLIRKSERFGSEAQDGKA
ncbi:MAG: hypothetical protein QXN59_03060 [Candidatus Micrarchaeaceae archaeon]